MDEKTRTRTSRYLSLVLRHRPAAAGVELDAGGWVDVEALLAGIAARRGPLSREELEEVVATSPKRRFALSEDGRRIRASQGHSVAIDLGYEPRVPPPELFHGTAPAALPAIRREGLRRMKRHAVHLSPDEETARAVGRRRGPPVILRVAADRMHADGHVFTLSENGVWLTDAVPPEYLTFPTT